MELNETLSKIQISKLISCGSIKDIRILKEVLSQLLDRIDRQELRILSLENLEDT